MSDTTIDHAALTRRVDELEQANEALKRRLLEVEAKLGIIRGGARVRPWLSPAPGFDMSSL